MCFTRDDLPVEAAIGLVPSMNVPWICIYTAGGNKIQRLNVDTDPRNRYNTVRLCPGSEISRGRRLYNPASPHVGEG
jgi:hypothetical protein